MKPSTYIIGIIVFTLFIVGGVSLMAIFRESDSTYADDPKFTEFNNTFNVYEELTDNVNDLSTGITEADSDFGALGVLNGLILTAWQGLKLMITNWSFMDSVFNGLTTVFGVPAWIPALIILAVVIMFVFALYSSFFQRDL